jgi:Na+/pantothenate symporter
MFITVPIGALMGPPMWIRFFAAEKKKSFDLIPLLICLTAIQCMGTLFAGSAGIVMAPGLKQTDSIIPVMLWQHGDMILSALLFCGVASAALSTANSQIHAVAAVYTIDIHKSLSIKPPRKEDGLHREMGGADHFGAGVSPASQKPVMIIYTGTVGMSARPDFRTGCGRIVLEPFKRESRTSV